MHTISLKEARKRLSELVHAVERGESIIITRHGKKVACLIPAEQKLQQCLPDLTEFRDSIQRKGGSLTEDLLAMRLEERE